MKKSLLFVLSIALFLCGLSLNAQRSNPNHNFLTTTDNSEIKNEEKSRVPEVKVLKQRGAEIVQIADDYHFPYDISDNKKHVAIQGFSVASSYYWSEEVGLIPIDGTAFSVTDEGVMAGYYTNGTGINVAGLWSPETKQWEFLGMNPDVPEFTDTEYNGAWTMTNDGKTVGVMQFDASYNTTSYLWTKENGYELLTSTSPNGTRPNGINGDGTVVAGHGVNENGFWFPCYWLNGEYNEIPDAFGEAMNVSDNGRYVCGYLDGLGGNGFVYDIEEKRLIEIENTVSPGNSLQVTCVTNEGNAFGFYAEGYNMPVYRRAFAYVGGELMTFTDYLIMNGVDAKTWTVYSVNSVTPDGKTFIGAANIASFDSSFILTLDDAPCEAPSNLTYTIDENNHTNVILNWEAPENAENVTYEIYDSHMSEEPLFSGIEETTFTIKDLEVGDYQFTVKANWGGECLSLGTNMVKLTIYPCAEENMCVLNFELRDFYDDGWNKGYIEIKGNKSDYIYKVELKTGGWYEEPTLLDLHLCPDTYSFTWMVGEYDNEVGFTISCEGEELFKIDTVNNIGTFLEYELNCLNDVNEIITENNISILPNPANNYFNIEGENIINVEIYNTTGQIVDAINVKNDNIKVSTDKYNNGIYFVKVITSDNKATIRKIVISK